MIRLILFFVLVYLFVQLLKKFFFAQPRSTRRMHDPFSGSGAAPAVREMVQDPVCKVYVPKKDALSLVRRGTTYYFCCEDCLKKFDSTNQ